MRMTKKEALTIVDIKERERSIGFLFAKIFRMRVVLFDRAVAPLNLTYAQAMALNYLMVDDGLTQIALARHMDLGTVTISGIIDRLEAGGWVVRKPDSRDRRVKTVWITEKVLAAKTELVKALEDLNDLTLSGLSEGEVTELVRLLRRAKSNLEKSKDGQE